MRQAQNLKQPTAVQELRSALRPNFGAFAAVVLFGVFVNLLVLTGPLFMLQVYDRVLISRSEETLGALLILVAILYAIMGVLDHARARISARIGANVQYSLDERILQRTIKRGGSGLRDLEAIQRLMSSPALFSVLDIPWTPIFAMSIFFFHPLLGWLALSGGALLILIAGLNRKLTSGLVTEANNCGLESDRFADTLRLQFDTVQGLGMVAATVARWQDMRNRSLHMRVNSSDWLSGFGSLGRTFRMFLQSAVLGLGAYLVLQDQMTSGGMIAASILTGRALAPVEQTIAQWPVIQQAHSGWRSLTVLEVGFANGPQLTPLCKPRALLEVANLSVIPPHGRTPTLKSVGFSIRPGQVLGVIGPSESGKSTLARHCRRCTRLDWLHKAGWRNAGSIRSGFRSPYRVSAAKHMVVRRDDFGKHCPHV